MRCYRRRLPRAAARRTLIRAWGKYQLVCARLNCLLSCVRSLNRERDDEEEGNDELDEDEAIDRLADRMFNDRLIGGQPGGQQE